MEKKKTLEDEKIDVDTNQSIDISEFKSFLKAATQERKNLQILLEFLDKKGDEFSEKKVLLEKVEQIIPKMDGHLVEFERKFDEIQKVETKMKEIKTASKEVTSIYNTTRRDVDNLNLLSEHVNRKIKDLTQQRTLVEKANEEAGRLNVLIWDMESKMKKLTEENKLVKKSEKNIGKLEHMLDSISDQVQEVVSYKELMKNTSQNIGELKSLASEIEVKSHDMRQERDDIEAISGESEKLQELFGHLKMETNELMKKQVVVAETKKMLDTFSMEIAEVKIESRNVAIKSKEPRASARGIKNLNPFA